MSKQIKLYKTFKQLVLERQVPTTGIIFQFRQCPGMDCILFESSAVLVNKRRQLHIFKILKHNETEPIVVDSGSNKDPQVIRCVDSIKSIEHFSEVINITDYIHPNKLEVLNDRGFIIYKDKEYKLT